MPIYQDMHGFPEAGLPVRKDVYGTAKIDRVVVKSLNPMLATGFLKHVQQTGELTIDGNTYVSSGTLGSYVPHYGAYQDTDLGSYKLSAYKIWIGYPTDDYSSTLQVYGGARFTNPSNLSLISDHFTRLSDRVGICLDPGSTSYALEVGASSVYSYYYENQYVSQFYLAYFPIQPTSVYGLYYDNNLLYDSSYYDDGSGNLISQYDYHQVGYIDYSNGYIDTTGYYSESISDINYNYYSTGEICAKFWNSVVFDSALTAKLVTLSGYSSTYPVATTDYTICAFDGTFPVELPYASNYPSRLLNIKNSGTGVVTVTAIAGEYIDGEATIDLAQHEGLSIQSNGGAWIIL